MNMFCKMVVIVFILMGSIPLCAMKRAVKRKKVSSKSKVTRDTLKKSKSFFAQTQESQDIFSDDFLGDLPRSKSFFSQDQFPEDVLPISKLSLTEGDIFKKGKLPRSKSWSQMKRSFALLDCLAGKEKS